MIRITRKQLKEVLRYNPKTGIWIWRKGARIGKTAGNIATDGRRQITIFYKTYVATNLAWLYVTGKWPCLHVDHKDGAASNDKWKNLRLATRGQNISNSKRRKDNSSGFKGVYLVKRTKKYQAIIGHNKRKIHLGCYETPTKAHWRYCRAARELKGEFARFS